MRQYIPFLQNLTLIISLHPQRLSKFDAIIVSIEDHRQNNSFQC